MSLTFLLDPPPRPLRGSALGAVTFATRAIRFGGWWYSKIPPLLAVAYLQIALVGLTEERALTLLPCLLTSIVCVAAYGYVVNDIFDIETDRRAGKDNAMAAVRPGFRLLFVAAPVVASFLPAMLVGYSAWSLVLLGTNFLLPTIYSLPPIRLKERGVLGLVCDLSGAHLVPTLFVLTALDRRNGSLFATQAPFVLLALVWSVVLGVKGILNHQVIDRDNDLASGTTTFATRTKAGTVERFLPRLNLFLECPVSAILVLVVLHVCPLAGVAFLGYSFLELLKHRLGFRFALTDNALATRVSFPFVNESFYVWWLPLAAALQLALLSPAWLWVPFFQVVLFVRTDRVQARDLRDVAVAAFRALRRWFRVTVSDWAPD